MASLLMRILDRAAIKKHVHCICHCSPNEVRLFILHSSTQYAKTRHEYINYACFYVVSSFSWQKINSCRAYINHQLSGKGTSVCM